MDAVVPGLVVFAFGLAVRVVGEVSIGPEGGDDSDDRLLRGARAPLLGGALMVSGLGFMASAGLGTVLLLGALALAWWLSP